VHETISIRHTNILNKLHTSYPARAVSCFSAKVVFNPHPMHNCLFSRCCATVLILIQSKEEQDLYQPHRPRLLCGSIKTSSSAIKHLQQLLCVTLFIHHNYLMTCLYTVVNHITATALLLTSTLQCC